MYAQQSHASPQPSISGNLAKFQAGTAREQLRWIAVTNVDQPRLSDPVEGQTQRFSSGP
jgi:hypothetical protein